ncbi:MAG: biopolymer transporter [Spirulina sp. DLM2.Bin59]|nr:MAG: biopolymer transporter [Spirulina sp. DLM2.Bin59]
MARPESGWVVTIIFGLLGLLLPGCGDRTPITPPPVPFGATLNSNAADEQPRLSYNGRYLVFTSDRGNQRRVYLYDLQRRQLIPLPGLNQPGVFTDQPDVSADGRYIVYVSEQYGKPDVFLYDRQQLRAEPLTRNLPGEARHPTISGNGRFIAYATNRTGQWQIEVFDRGVESPTSLPGGEGPAEIPGD